MFPRVSILEKESDVYCTCMKRIVIEKKKQEENCDAQSLFDKEN